MIEKNKKKLSQKEKYNKNQNIYYIEYDNIDEKL